MFWAFRLQMVRSSGVRPAGSYAVIRDGAVYDASLDVFVSRVDWGTPARELRWRCPDFTPVPWEAFHYRETEAALSHWIAEWSADGALLDVRRGWFEIPRPTSEDWRRLVTQVIPSQAGWIGGGIAPHPLLARWTERAGPALKLPCWKTPEGFSTWICSPDEAPRVWASVPLSALSGLDESEGRGDLGNLGEEQRRWAQLGFRRVGDVTGLSLRLARRFQASSLGKTPVIQITRRFSEPLVAGLNEVLEDMAQALSQQLITQALSARALKLSWQSEEGADIVRRRAWAYPSADRKVWLLRALNLVDPWPREHPTGLTLTAEQCEQLMTEQLDWWGPEKGTRRATVPSLRELGWQPFVASSREVRFGYWDPLRRRDL